jgi:hypothetical protein
MILTKHAEVRIQQRCIPELILDLLLQYGEVEHQHGGTELVYFKARNFAKARNHLESMLKEFDRLRDAYLVRSRQDEEDIIITSGYLQGSPRTKTNIHQ